MKIIRYHFHRGFGVSNWLINVSFGNTARLPTSVTFEWYYGFSGIDEESCRRTPKWMFRVFVRIRKRQKVGHIMRNFPDFVDSNHLIWRFSLNIPREKRSLGERLAESHAYDPIRHSRWDFWDSLNERSKKRVKFWTHVRKTQKSDKSMSIDHSFGYIGRSELERKKLEPKLLSMTVQVLSIK